MVTIFLFYIWKVIMTPIIRAAAYKIVQRRIPQKVQRRILWESGCFLNFNIINILIPTKGRSRDTNFVLNEIGLYPLLIMPQFIQMLELS